MTEQLNLTGGLITISNITIFEEKLMQNFYIINNKLKKLEEFNDLESRLRGVEKQLKFTNLKIDTISQKIPKDGLVSKTESKQITKEQLIDIFNNQDDRFRRSKFVEDIRRDIKNIIEELTRFGSKKQFYNPNTLENNSQLLDENPSQLSPQNKLSLTARQVLIDSQVKRGIIKQSLEDCLEKNQMKMVNNIINSDNPIQELHEKIQDLYKKIQQLRIGKTVNDLASKAAQRFEKYQRYQQKSQQKNRSSIKLEGIKHQNLKGELLKNDLYSEMQKAEMVRNQLNRQLLSRKSIKGTTTFTSYKDQQVKKITNFQEDPEPKFQRSKSTKKLQRIERRLKADDIKDLNPVLKQIEIRIQNKVSHDIFMGFIQDFEQKLEILKINNDNANESHQIRKIINSIEHRLNSIVNYLQTLASEDEALLVKKQWTCVSCDKNLQKYGGKVGQHLNWDILNSKKLSPSKAGAFGQTSQLANKIRNIMQNQKVSQQ